MKEKLKIFLRTAVLGTVISLSLILGGLSVFKAYENIRFVGFGEYKKAVEITENSIRILDFTINF